MIYKYTTQRHLQDYDESWADIQRSRLISKFNITQKECKTEHTFLTSNGSIAWDGRTKL